MLAEMPELSLDDVAIFVKVVEKTGFAGAARELRVPTSTVSRAIARLESSAGVRLLHRTTRIVRPTSEGRALYDSSAHAVASLRHATGAIEPASRKPKGRLRVAAPGDLSATFLADTIVAFMERHPLVELEFSLGNAHTDLVDQGFDVAVRATASLRDSSLVARKLGELAHGLYASPSYLRKHGVPTAPSDLSRHQCIVFRGKDLVRTWTLRDGAAESATEIHGRVGGDDFSFVRAMMLRGAGIGLCPMVLCKRDEEDGKLVRVLPGFSARGATLYVIYPSRHKVPARVTAFRDFVVDAFDAWANRQPDRR